MRGVSCGPPAEHHVAQFHPGDGQDIGVWTGQAGCAVQPGLQRITQEAGIDWYSPTLGDRGLGFFEHVFDRLFRNRFQSVRRFFSDVFQLRRECLDYSFYALLCIYLLHIMHNCVYLIHGQETRHHQGT